MFLQDFWQMLESPRQRYFPTLDMTRAQHRKTPGSAAMHQRACLAKCLETFQSKHFSATPPTPANDEHSLKYKLVLSEMLGVTYLQGCPPAHHCLSLAEEAVGTMAPALQCATSYSEGSPWTHSSQRQEQTEVEY